MPTATLTVPRFSPAGLASSGTELGEQAAFVSWCNRAMWVGVAVADEMAGYAVGTPQAALVAAAVKANFPALPELRWIHAVPNGGERSRASAGNAKAEGVKRGVADLCWPVPCGRFHGLYLEMKRCSGKPSDVTDEQNAFGAFVLSRGYQWHVCFGWQQARLSLLNYVLGKD